MISEFELSTCVIVSINPQQVVWIFYYSLFLYLYERSSIHRFDVQLGCNFNYFITYHNNTTLCVSAWQLVWFVNDRDGNRTDWTLAARCFSVVINHCFAPRAMVGHDTRLSITEIFVYVGSFWRFLDSFSSRSINIISVCSPRLQRKRIYRGIPHLSQQEPTRRCKRWSLINLT